MSQDEGGEIATHVLHTRSGFVLPVVVLTQADGLSKLQVRVVQPGGPYHGWTFKPDPADVKPIPTE